MEGLYFNYMELSIIAAALLYRSAVPDYFGIYRHVYDKIVFFIKNSDSDNFYLQQLL